jgi:antitoxin component YwqK of YwqJK toxin-antitoxin module
MSRLAASGAAFLALVLALSCAGTPPAPAPEASVAVATTTTTTTTIHVPVRKERSILVKLPYLQKETVYYPDGLVDVWTVLGYADGGKTLLEKKTFDASRPEPIERVAYEYQGGRLAAEVLYDNEGRLKSRREYGYDASGKLVSEKLLDARGQAQSSSAYAYDATGNRVEWKAFNDKGMLQATTTYAWAAGGLAEIGFRNAAGVLTGSIKVERPAPGQEKRSYLAADKTLQKVEVSYFENGNLRRFESRRADGSLAQVVDYRLGALGEALESSTSDGQGKLREKRIAEFGLREEQQIEVYYE